MHLSNECATYDLKRNFLSYNTRSKSTPSRRERYSNSAPPETNKTQANYDFNFLRDFLVKVVSRYIMKILECEFKWLLYIVGKSFKFQISLPFLV